MAENSHGHSPAKPRNGSQMKLGMARIRVTARERGAALMVGSVAIVGVGFVFTRLLPPLQGTVGMTLFGGGILIAFAVSQEGFQALNPRNLTPAQRRGMMRHALTSSLMKIGGPIAFAQIGAGPYACITAMGSLLAGAALTSSMGRMLRVATFLGVLIATGALIDTQHVSFIGFAAAMAAATHPFDLPSQAKLLGDKRDQGIAQANIICILVVIPLCLPLSEHLGTPIGDWKWGPAELGAMLMAGLFATALAAVMQIRSSAYLSKADMGAWAATAPAVQSVVAVACAPLLALVGRMTLIPNADQWPAFGIVTITAAAAVLVDSKAAEAARDTTPGTSLEKRE